MIPATAALLTAFGRARFAVHPAARRERPVSSAKYLGEGTSRGERRRNPLLSFILYTIVLEPETN